MLASPHSYRRKIQLEHISLHTPHFSLLSPHSSLHTPHSTLLTPHSSLKNILCTEDHYQTGNQNISTLNRKQCQGKRLRSYRWNDCVPP